MAIKIVLIILLLNGCVSLEHSRLKEEEGRREGYMNGYSDCHDWSEGWAKYVK